MKDREFLKVFSKGESKTPVWMMRQAGRYLPEYRALRKKAGSFLELCYTPDLAAEITLQPIERFGFDAAILFSDILVIPDALGLDVTFTAGEGPCVEKISTFGEVSRLRDRLPSVVKRLSPVFKAVKLVRERLEDKKALIGFCGAPWTVASYMVDEKPSKDTINLRTMAYREPKTFDALMQVLVEASVLYLCEQIKSGADVLQIFDSWAGSVPHDLFETAVLEPILAICKGVKAQHPDVPIIVFPRLLKQPQLLALAKEGHKKALFEGMGLDYTQDITWARDNLLPYVALQGNLDPAILVAGPTHTTQAVKDILAIMAGKKGFILNLGHGIVPHTPIESVEALVSYRNITTE